MSDERDEIQEHDEKLVTEVIQQLRRHFDTVEIFVTRDEPEGKTLAFADGAGNWYARFGQVQEWLDNGGAMHIEGDDE